MKVCLLCLIVLVLSSCGKKQTSWENDWSFPLLDDSLTMANFYNDSTIVVDPNNSLEINFYRTLLDLSINDFIRIPDTLITQIFSPALNISNVPPGTEFVNDIQDNPLDLQGIELKKVIVKKGEIILTAFNPLNTGVIMTVELPGSNKEGAMFSQSFFLESGSISSPSSATLTLQLDGYELDLSGQGGLDFNVLQSKLSIQTDPNGETIDISSNCDFEARVEVRNIALDYAKGYFGERLIEEVNTSIVSVLSRIVEGNLDIDLSQLTLEIENGFKCLFSVKLNSLSNSNFNGNTVNLSSVLLDNALVVSQAMGSWESLLPSVAQFEFDNTNSNVESFLENVGANLAYDYSIQINPLGNISGGTDEIFPNSKIKVKLKIKAPLVIGFDSFTIRDTFDISLSQDFSKSHVNFAEFKLRALNSFPVSASPLLYLLDEDNTVLHTVIGDAQVSTAMMGDLNPDTGLMEKESLVRFIFSEELLSDINSIKKIIVELRLDTPNPISGVSEMMEVPFGAKVLLKMLGNFNTTVLLQ